MCGPGVATGCALFVAWADASALLQPICEELGWYTPDTDSGDVVHAALASQLCAPWKTSTSNGGATSTDPARARHSRCTQLDPLRGHGQPRGYGYGRQRRRPECSKTVISISIITNTAARARNRNADSNKVDADVPPPNLAEEQMHILSLHLRWNSCPSSVRAATRFIERAFPRLCAREHCSSSRSSSKRERGARSIRPLAPHPHRTIFAGGDKATTGETRVIVEPYCVGFVHCVGAGSRCALLEGGVPCHQSRGGRWTHRDISMRLQHSGWLRGQTRE